jgi:RNA 2',3'-cyclic 3'-phosphodiesterase
MRLFAAVWPPEEVLDHLDLALTSVRATGQSSSLRWSARETWHLTAAFYGEVPEGAVPALATGLADAVGQVEPYSLALRGAGLFSHRTLWVGVGGDVEAQRRLARACAAAGEAAGAWHDDRPRERPHLTVGRIRPGSRPPRRRASPAGATAPSGRRGPGDDDDPAACLVRAMAVYDGPSWLFDEVVLVESTPGAGRGGGPLYVPVERLLLAAPTGPI